MTDLTEFKTWVYLNCSSPESAETHYQKVKAFFLHREEFNQSTLNSFLLEKQEKWSNSSLNIYINAFKWYAKYLKMEIEFPKFRKTDVKVKTYITQKELQEIFDKLSLIFDNPLKIQVILLLLFEGGLRPKELLNLKRNDIEFTTKNLIIRNTKVKRDRQIPLSDNLCKLLIVFFNNEAEIDNAFNLSKYMLKYIFQRINQCLNLKNKLNPYSFRHSFAHNMIKNGINLSSLQLKLGHATVLTTMNYLRVNDQEASDEMRDILNKRKR